MDFFLWGYLKQHVYATPPPTLEDLQRRIPDACANVTPTMPHHVQREVQYVNCDTDIMTSKSFTIVELIGEKLSGDNLSNGEEVIQPLFRDAMEKKTHWKPRTCFFCQKSYETSGSVLP
ncbi:hypothetical protein AVEN_245213-1 [Araneus ventricosus]|uniref:Uncharacterized protein n=1 Tax=Araneus ventricosus TaxID=182803 RepID=A0A4Y2WRP0_ARAVE|nr:hypothetical protein AVEN_245213-1 [Araneus ventricosus]